MACNAITNFFQSFPWTTSVCAVFFLLLSSCGYGPPARFQERPRPSNAALEKLMHGCVTPSAAFPSIVWEKGERKVEVDHGGEKVEIDTFYALGGDCIPRPVSTVWATLHNAAGLQWDKSTLETLKRKEAQEVDGILFRLETFQHANEFIQPSWFIEWSHRLLSGTINTPEEVQVTFQKTEGTGFIEHWAGQILFHRIDAANTAVFMEIELSGARIGVEKCEGAVTSQLARIRNVEPDFSRFP